MRFLLPLLLVTAQAWAAPPRIAARLAAFATAAPPPSLERARDGRVGVSVRLAGGATALQRAGFEVEAEAGEVAYLRLDASELRRLALLEGVRAIEPTRRLRPSLDQSVPRTGATVVRAQTGLTGRGAIVGVVDTGIDFRHPDFRDRETGATRLAALLDMSQPADGRHPEWPNLDGAAWSGAEIDEQLRAEAAGESPAVPVTEVDGHGHGTHVAGIAAGSGEATGRGFAAGRYVGMAPGATLIVVKATREGPWFSELDVIKSARFVIERAHELGLPAVVNLSLSGEGGPHDGTTNLEQALAALFPRYESGQALVVAAGNQGSRQWHAGGWSLDGAHEVSFSIPKNDDATDTYAFDLWFDDGPAVPSLAIVAPGGRVFGPVRSGDHFDSGDERSEGRVVVSVSAAPDPLNHRREAFVDIRGSRDRPVREGEWRLVLEGKSLRWDAWMIPSDEALAPRFLDTVDFEETAQLPAYCPSAIAVGSLVSRAQWVTVNGNLVDRPIVVGEPSSFSGSGPSLDGRFLPDVVAPGEFIASSMSSSATPEHAGSVFIVPTAPDYLWADDGVHGLLRGTSQATPHVSGAVALLLERDPLLTPRRLREIVRTAARLQPGSAGFSPKTGFGELDVAEALRIVNRVPGGRVDPHRSSVGLSRDHLPPGAGSVRVSVVPRDAEGHVLGGGHRVDISTTAGRFEDEVFDWEDGRYERRLTATAMPGTLGRITVFVDGVELASHPGVLFSASLEPPPDEEETGCRTGRHPPPTGATLLAAAALLLLVARRRGRTCELARARSGR